jgi:hypothetical protein
MRTSEPATGACPKGESSTLCRDTLSSTLSNSGQFSDKVEDEVRDKAVLRRVVAGADPSAGYMLIETLVYISLLFVLLGIAYVAFDRCLDHSIALRRAADDIANALHVGERWRADVRAANTQVRSEDGPEGPVLHLLGARGELAYRFSNGALFRRLGQGAWVRLLDGVRSSAMMPDARAQVIAWRWELELQPRGKASVKPGRVRPLFTFLAVPEAASPNPAQ